MPVELIKEKYAGPINTVEIGHQGPESIKIGGQTTLPFLFEEGEAPNRQAIAMEVLDCEPVEWPEVVKHAFGESLRTPVSWALKCVNDFHAKILCVRLQSIHPDYGGKSPDHSVEVIRAIINQTSVPLIVVGCGDDELDSVALPKVSQALKGENCLLGVATQKNYRTLAATALADGHVLIAESPIDINIAKQVNILISDMGFDPKKIVMHPTTTSLGYGMEYVYSIMERSRLAAFMGDKMLAMPFVAFVGQETWKTKEAKEPGVVQGINWEIATAVSLLHSGADLLVMRHPDAVSTIVRYLDAIMKGAK